MPLKCRTVFLIVLAFLSATNRMLLAQPAEIPVRAHDPLQDSHLVFRGILRDVTVEMVTLGDWGVLPRTDDGANQEMHVTKLTLSPTELMKGGLPAGWLIPGPGVKVYVVGALAPLFEQGREYILCCTYFTKAKVYTTGTGIGIYVKKGQRWDRQLMAHDNASTESLTIDQVHARIGAVSLPSMTASSDVIVRGTVSKVWRSTYATANGRIGELVNVRVAVKEQLKGSSHLAVLDFVVPRAGARANVVPSWFRWAPIDVREGEQWLLFLRSGELGLYPFAGPNSMLRVDGDSLIYDLAVTYEEDTPRTLAKIKKEVASEH